LGKGDSGKPTKANVAAHGTNRCAQHPSLAAFARDLQVKPWHATDRNHVICFAARMGQTLYVQRPQFLRNPRHASYPPTYPSKIKAQDATGCNGKQHGGAFFPGISTQYQMLTGRVATGFSAIMAGFVSANATPVEPSLDACGFRSDRLRILDYEHVR
jgi:hypothetical protein